MKARRIVQRIEAQRWTYYVQTRVWLFFYRDAHGPFATRAAAMESQTILRARDDYGGRLPWEQARIQSKPKRKRPEAYPVPTLVKNAGARKPPAEAGILLTQEELT